MKIILWIGNEPNQKALANKIHSIFPLEGIVTETRNYRRKLSARLILEKIFEKLFFPSIGKSWWNLQKKYDEQFPYYPDVSRLEVENINSDEVYDFTMQSQPDLILVSGTRLIKEKMLLVSPTIGILNLHTGLSPYMKGGPNCTNWCIANKDFHLIGNTIMWIDKGIDTGNLLTTEFTTIEGDENLSEIHIKVMEHAHDLYIRTLKYLSDGKKQSISQNDISNGQTFYNKQWTLIQKIKTVRNHSLLKSYYKDGKVIDNRKNIKTIKLYQ